VSRSDEQRVQDILDACEQILEVVRDGRAAWDKDRLRQVWVIAEVEVSRLAGQLRTDHED
jgi:sulfite reductase beta subunit-like hemoprotein